MTDLPVPYATIPTREELSYWRGRTTVNSSPPTRSPVAAHHPRHALSGYPGVGSWSRLAAAAARSPPPLHRRRGDARYTVFGNGEQVSDVFARLSGGFAPWFALECVGRTGSPTTPHVSLPSWIGTMEPLARRSAAQRWQPRGRRHQHHGHRRSRARRYRHALNVSF